MERTLFRSFQTLHIKLYKGNILMFYMLTFHCSMPFNYTRHYASLPELFCFFFNFIGQEV